MSDNCHYVYRCYDGSGQLLYIGCTQYPDRRIREHEKRAHWTSQMVEHYFEGPYGYYEGFAVEKAAIEAERPLHNIQWNPRFQRAEDYGPAEWQDSDSPRVRKAASLRRLAEVTP